MQISMLNQLLDGTFPDFVDASIPLPEDIEEEIAEAEEKLVHTFTPEQTELFNNYYLANLGIVSTYKKAYFKRGFRSGLMLTAEACYMEYPTPSEIWDDINTHSKKWDRIRRQKASSQTPPDDEAEGEGGRETSASSNSPHSPKQ